MAAISTPPDLPRSIEIAPDMLFKFLHTSALVVATVYSSIISPYDTQLGVYLLGARFSIDSCYLTSSEDGRHYRFPAALDPFSPGVY
jgi:hypothetical protein